MASATKHAWVSSSREGYVLQINGDNAPQYACLRGAVFDTFRAAQSIANAIRQECKAKAIRQDCNRRNKRNDT